jgi:hypothetical protein
MVLPAIVFLAAAVVVRPDLQIGWAMLLWPVTIVLGCMYAFALKALALVRYPDASVAGKVSASVLIGCLVIAIVLALTVPPWYD